MQADPSEAIKMKLVNETLQAVCFKNLPWASLAKNLLLEKVYFDDHSISVFIPAQGLECIAFHYAPELSGKWESSKVLAAFLVGLVLVLVLWLPCLLGAWILVHGLITMPSRNLPEVHIEISVAFVNGTAYKTSGASGAFVRKMVGTILVLEDISSFSDPDSTILRSKRKDRRGGFGTISALAPNCASSAALGQGTEPAEVQASPSSAVESEVQVLL
ncbi:hypothetical protein H920_01507 [Fukomys damarensis]|uniref:Uncharacterized protein n=1 Tax=Fukomys damarensis TaxID=885580 RepID=A0A091E3G2_FUKDA|nr:hypothetical protein H920_01507 [Fukomys damarensis]